MKEIKLTQGKVALVDDEDFEYLNQFKWCAHKECNTYYAVRNAKNNGKLFTQYMHNLIIGIIGVDHKNHEGLDNQKHNLRIANKSQNAMNNMPLKNMTSKYKGVSWFKRDKKWRAVINEKHIGLFIDEIEAAKAYDNKAAELFGEFACLNFKI